MRTKILSFFALLAIVILQIALVPFLPSPWSSLQLPIWWLLWQSLQLTHTQTIGWGLLLGSLLDLYHEFGYGVITLSLLLMVTFIYFLRDNFLTNRTLVSFLSLGMAAIIFYPVCIVAFTFLYQWLNLASAQSSVGAKIFNNFGFVDLATNLIFLILLSLIFIKRIVSSNFVLKNP